MTGVQTCALPIYPITLVQHDVFPDTQLLFQTIHDGRHLHPCEISTFAYVPELPDHGDLGNGIDGCADQPQGEAKPQDHIHPGRCDQHPALAGHKSVPSKEGQVQKGHGIAPHNQFQQSVYDPGVALFLQYKSSRQPDGHTDTSGQAGKNQEETDINDPDHHLPVTAHMYFSAADLLPAILQMYS